MALLYTSTRGGVAPAAAGQALLAGAAGDGGLFWPQQIPVLYPAVCQAGSYAQAAWMIQDAFLGADALPFSQVRQLYEARFAAPAICPLRQLGEHYVLELFHGPTAAFKDVALSVLPALLAQARQRIEPGRPLAVLAATSGDTGSATLSGFADIAGMQAIVFYPQQGISAIQRLQMVTMTGANLRACAITGNFDDAQRGVKAIFAAWPRQPDPKARLSSANSINIGRLIPQMVYYFTSYAQLAAQGQIRPDEPVNFFVPSGNFGDILAGYLSRLAGLPIAILGCASNQNSVLADFLTTGCYDRRRALVKTHSPSMDILVSSNLERLLFSQSGGDAPLVASAMKNLETQGHYQIAAALLDSIRSVFVPSVCGQEQTLRTIRQVFNSHRYLLDPHTAAAWHGMESFAHFGGNACKNIVLATASPYKFPQTMLHALGQPLPNHDLQALDALATYSGTTPPPSLVDLAARPVLHADVIAPQEMEHYICRQVNRL